MSAPRILVVEDNPISRKIVRLALTREGYEVQEAGDGATALALSGKFLPDLILQDLGLPDMDGFTLASQLRGLAELEGVPILAFSGFLTRLEFGRTSAVGFTDFISKPVEPSRLVETIRQHLPLLPRASPHPKRGLRVLLVDDDAVQLKLGKLALANLGFAVTGAADGRAALAAALKNPPDAILSDVLMPGMDGFELTMEIRRDPLLLHVPVVLVSSNYVEKADEDLAKNAGASALLVRTPDLRDAADALVRAREGRLGVPTFRPKGELEEQHRLRVLKQLERQLAMNAAYAYRASMYGSMLSVVEGVAESLTRSQELASYLPEVLTSLLDAAGVSKGAIALLDAKGSFTIESQVGLSAEGAGAITELLDQLAAGRKSGMEKGPVVIPSPAFPEDKAGFLLERTGAQSVLVIPIHHASETLGLLVLASNSRDLTEPDWVPFGKTMGIQVGQALALANAFQKLAASERRHRALLENANDAIGVLDPQGRIREVNPKVETLVGRPRADIVGRKWEEFIASEDRGRARDQLRRLVGGGATTIENIRFMRSDGTRVSIEMSASVVTPGPDGSILVIGRDITERLEAFRRVQESEERLRQAQKMEAMGRLAGGVAHDFNNLLTAILGFSELTMARLPQNDSIRSELQEVLKAGHRAAALTRQMLAFSRRQVLQPRLLDLNERVTDVLKMLKRLIGEDIELVTRLAPGLGLVMADPGQIEQVIMNLAINSRDAMPGGGRLILETGDVQLRADSMIGGGAVAAGPFVMLALIDAGTAMTDEVKSHLFEPFFTTKEIGKGTGLGLATVYGIVKQSGGHITVESEIGKGTTIRVYMPRVEGERESKTSIAIPRARTGTETILLIEDEEAVRKLAAAVLRKSGYGVFEAGNGAEGLELVARQPGKIDLTITDVVMPVMSGHEFSRRLAERSPATRVIFMSGYSDTAVHQLAMTAEIPFLQKPFTSEQLLSKVREVLDSNQPDTP